VDVATGLLRTLLVCSATVLVPPLAVWICVVLCVPCFLVAGSVILWGVFNDRVVCVFYSL